MTDEQLVKNYKSGDLSAFNEIYFRYKNLVKYHARNLFLLGAESDDLVQEGMLGLIKAVDGFKDDGQASFKTYASVCIRSSLLTAVKRYSSNNESPLNNSDSFDILDNIVFMGVTPEESVEMKENSSELKFKILNSLSKTEILVLNLYLQGLSYQEIGERLLKNAKFADNALSRARKKIINCIGE